MRLDELQGLFQRAVRFRETPAELVRHVHGGGSLEAEAAIDVYRRMYWYRLVDAHFALFPAMATYLGKARFTQLVTSCLAVQPSRTPVLERLAAPFAVYCAHVLPEASTELDLCRLEATSIASLLSMNAEGILFAHAHTQRSDFADLRLRKVPSVGLVNVSTRVHAHYEAWSREEPTDEGHLGSSANGARPGERTWLVVARRAFSVERASVSAAEAECIARGELSVGEALVTLANETNDLNALYETLARWMAMDLFQVDDE